jgi:hypothetical protein
MMKLAPRSIAISAAAISAANSVLFTLIGVAVCSALLHVQAADSWEDLLSDEEDKKEKAAAAAAAEVGKAAAAAAEDAEGDEESSSDGDEDSDDETSEDEGDEDSGSDDESGSSGSEESSEYTSSEEDSDDESEDSDDARERRIEEARVRCSCGGCAVFLLPSMSLLLLSYQHSGWHFSWCQNPIMRGNCFVPCSLWCCLYPLNLVLTMPKRHVCRACFDAPQNQQT